MKVFSYKCDRCLTESENSTGWITLPPARLHGVSIDSTLPAYDYDLCPSCVHSFESWLKRWTVKS